MNKSSAIFFGILTLILLTHVSIAYAVLPPTETNTPTPIATNTPTPTPSNTQTPTPTATPTITVTPTGPQISGTISPIQESTDAGNVVSASPSPTPTSAGIQTKDIVTYALIGAVLLILLAQAFWPKKGKTPGVKTEEPKNG